VRLQPYWNRGNTALYLGNNLAVMATMADCSVDAVVTDPPYGLEFMGKEWDCLTRNLMNPTSEADIVRKEQYGSGYAGRRSNLPDLSKSGGKAAQEWHEVWARECLRLLKPGGYLLAFGGTRTYHRLTCAIEDAGFEIRDCVAWMYGQGFPKSLDVSKAIDKAAGAEREVVGGYMHGGTRQSGIKGKDLGQVWHNETSPATPAARQWDGWGTALKPAFEPIVVARKPLSEPTVAKNVLRWGTGAINVDGCRIEVDADDPVNGAKYYAHPSVAYGKYASKERGDIRNMTPRGGRWPANLVLDEEAAAMLDEQSGERPAGKWLRTAGARPFNNNGAATEAKEWQQISDTGGASRFFYCAKASKASRGEGNDHPTVKPVALMRWLVRLVTPPGGIVLDPFGGSGTTAIACMQEGVGCTLIEQDEHSCDIARGRVEREILPLLEVAL
jgi:DNA modification methylase